MLLCISLVVFLCIQDLEKLLKRLDEKWTSNFSKNYITDDQVKKVDGLNHRAPF